MASLETRSRRIKEDKQRPIDASIDALSEKVAAQIEKNILIHFIPTGKHKAGSKTAIANDDVGAVIRAVIHETVHKALAGSSAHSHQLRMDFLETLFRYEKQMYGPSAQEVVTPRSELRTRATDLPDDPLLSTAEAGKILGFSRMYITMLVDANKLPAASVSAGGHRRIRQSDVLKYRDQLATTPKDTSDYKAVAQETGMYDIAEEDYIDVVTRPATKKPRAKRQPKSAIK
jgi:excisionase family DNA binding protein